MSDKVINIFSAKKSEKSKNQESESDENLTFEQIMQRNQSNAERVRKERLSKNKGVLRSYRIKP